MGFIRLRQRRDRAAGRPRHVARDMRKQKTYCQSIPRIYSGLAYDFCVLNAPPDPTGVLVPFVVSGPSAVRGTRHGVLCRTRFIGRSKMAISIFTGVQAAGD